MIETFEDMIELMHTYWCKDDEIHKNLDKLLELYKKKKLQIFVKIVRIMDIIKMVTNMDRKT